MSYWELKPLTYFRLPSLVVLGSWRIPSSSTRSHDSENNVKNTKHCKLLKKLKYRTLKFSFEMSDNSGNGNFIQESHKILLVTSCSELINYQWLSLITNDTALLVSVSSFSFSNWVNSSRSKMAIKIYIVVNPLLFDTRPLRV